MTGISIRNLNKSYASLQVLRDINLDVGKGDFTVLLGPSGCGKSTLLGAIAGLDPIDQGGIVIDGRDVTDVEPNRRGIAMVFQSYALYPTMTVRRNLSFGLQVSRLPRAEIDRRVAWAAGLLQIEALLDRKPGQLSGGQRPRVAIGRALVRNSDIVLFDEPLSNLDAKLRTEMRVEIKRLHRELGSTVVYVTHDQIEAMTLATRIAVMRGGRIEQYADPETVYERPASLFVAGFVGSPAMNFLPGELLARGSAAVRLAGGDLPLGGYAFEAAPDEGAEVVLGVRPEHVGLAEDGAPGPAAEAETLFVEPMGADSLAWFDLGGQRVSARLQPHKAKGIGGRVRLAFDVARASVFCRRTERRI